MSLPDDGRMDIADTVTIGNIVASRISPALKEAVVGMSIVATQNFSNAVNTIKWVKSGSLVAEGVNEGQVYTPTDANSDINDTSVTSTAAKIMVHSNVSHEALQFSGGMANFARIGDEQGRAIGRKYDDDLLALFNSITNVATATSTMDTDTLLTAQFNIYNANCPPGPLVALLGYKQVAELKKVVATSGAAQYANASQIAILNGTPAANNFVGNFLGIDIYQTTGHSTTGGDIQGGMWNPLYGFCSGVSQIFVEAVQFTGAGVASQVPGVSYSLTSWIYYDIDLWNNTCCSEVRSDS